MLRGRAGLGFEFSCPLSAVYAQGSWVRDTPASANKMMFGSRSRVPEEADHAYIEALKTGSSSVGSSKSIFFLESGFLARMATLQQRSGDHQGSPTTYQARCKLPDGANITVSPKSGRPKLGVPR